MPKKETAVSLQRVALRQVAFLRKTVTGEISTVLADMKAKEDERRAQVQQLNDMAAGIQRLEQQMGAVQGQLDVMKGQLDAARVQAEAAQATLQILLENQGLLADLVFTGTARVGLATVTGANRLENIIAENDLVPPMESHFCPKPTHGADGRIAWIEQTQGSAYRFPDVGWRTR